MKRFFTVILFLVSAVAFAHPMPNSIIELSVVGNEIHGVAKMPLQELENAITPLNSKISDSTFLQNYFKEHIAAKTGQKIWGVLINDISFFEGKDVFVGKYKEVMVKFMLIPPIGISTRNFTFKYDAIVHQVVTHKILVFLKQDWKNGVYNEDDTTTQSDENLIGAIQTDIATGQVLPLEVSLKNGSNWEGFKTMVKLGVHHISEGIDHLLFLFMLLLTAPLISAGKKWHKNNSFKQSLKKILKITLAFTIGHSITLALATLGWVSLPAQPIEIIIALSILVTAAHAISPLFSRKESLIAGGFGLIHGMAFAAILTSFNLTGKPFLISLLGFNLGIELMQLFVIIITVPWLILLSNYPSYKYIRVTGALLAGLAAIAWLLERITALPNCITTILENAPDYGKYLVLVIAVVTMFIYLKNKRTVSTGSTDL